MSLAPGPKGQDERGKDRSRPAPTCPDTLDTSRPAPSRAVTLDRLRHTPIRPGPRRQAPTCSNMLRHAPIRSIRPARSDTLDMLRQAPAHSDTLRARAGTGKATMPQVREIV
jgi:hypothetical protein